MKRKDYIRILLAPLGMLTVFACSPNQFQTNQEYDDVYFTSSDRMSKPTIIESTEEVNSSNEQAFSLGDYSNESVDPVLVSKYNNGQSDEVTYYEEGLRVKQASELNYDDFVFDYENENLAYYDLPLDWESDWDRSSFNRLMLTDYQFQLAWYDQYYLGSSGRMNSYLSGTTGRANRRFNSGFGRPSVGIDIGFSSFGFSPFYSAGMTFVNLNPFGFYDPFWGPIPDPFWRTNRRFNSFYAFGGFGFNDPWGWNNFGYNRPWGWNRFGGNNFYTSNYYFGDGNIVNRDGRSVSRGARISSTSVSSVRTDAVNGSVANTRSSAYVNNGVTRSSRPTSSTNSVRSARSSSTVLAPTTRSSRVSTNAYQFSDDSRLTRSNIVRSSSSTRSSRVSSTARTSSYRSTASSSRSSANNNLFSRSSSSRTATPTYSRSSSSSRSSGVSSSRSSRSSSSSSRSSGVSSSRSSSSGSSVRSSSSSSSRSGGSSSSSSRSSSGNSSSSRSGRGN